MAIDSHFSQVSALLHFDGANGATTTTDVKGNTVTRNGTPTISTTQSKFGGSSAVFTATQSFEVAAGAGLQMGAGDFTVEGWIRPNGVTGIQDFLNTFASSASDSGFVFQTNGTAIVGIVYIGASGVSATSASGVIAANTWHHVALVRSGINLYVFVAGVLVASVATLGTSSMNAVAQALNIGAEGAVGTSSGMAGYIDEVRVTKGYARYTANFTPPTAQFPDAIGSVSGIVKDSSGTPVARTLRAYRRDTGALVGSAVSDGSTGAYSFDFTTLDELSVVCLDDVAGSVENDLVIRVTPA